MSWRNLAIVLGLLCSYQAWRTCNRPAAKAPEVTAAAECKEPSTTHSRRSTWDDSSPSEGKRADDGDSSASSASMGPSINGFKLPAWTLYFAPQPGESMLSYRDRMLPLAQAALAPHRARVARGRDDFATKVNLDSQQRAQLDAAVQEAAGVIQDKVMGSLLGGDLMPKNFKPMTGVTLARDVLDAVDKANARFMSTLREDQKAMMAKHPFDFADYMLFSARWEDALGVMH